MEGLKNEKAMRRLFGEMVADMSIPHRWENVFVEGKGGAWFRLTVVLETLTPFCVQNTSIQIAVGRRRNEVCFFF